jgi:hypothetical protein
MKKLQVFKLNNIFFRNISLTFGSCCCLWVNGSYDWSSLDFLIVRQINRGDFSTEVTKLLSSDASNDLSEISISSCTFLNCSLPQLNYVKGDSVFMIFYVFFFFFF